MIGNEWARGFAQEWCEAWNAGDLERIFSHYADDFQMTSPRIVERMGVATGVLRGKDAIRPYWADGLARRPALKFELIDVFCGVSSVAIHYRSVVAKHLCVETIEFDVHRKGIRAEALYRNE